MTFRTVSDGPGSEGKWVNEKGIRPRKFLDRAQEWAENTWEKEILPSILDKYK